MSIPFQDSETAKNLLRAFAGESQARNRYDFAANLCQKRELQAMAFIFKPQPAGTGPRQGFLGPSGPLNGQICYLRRFVGHQRILELRRPAQ